MTKFVMAHAHSKHILLLEFLDLMLKEYLEGICKLQNSIPLSEITKFRIAKGFQKPKFLEIQRVLQAKKVTSHEYNLKILAKEQIISNAQGTTSYNVLEIFNTLNSSHKL